MQKKLELMRSLTAMQAALWDVIDEPENAGKRSMLEIMMMAVVRQTGEVLGKERAGQ